MENENKEVVIEDSSEDETLGDGEGEVRHSGSDGDEGSK